MNKIVILITAILFFSCSQLKEKKSESKIEIIKAKCVNLSRPSTLSVDSIIDRFLDENRYNYRLNELDSSLKYNWLDDIAPLSNFKGLYEAYFLYFINKVDDKALITIFCETDSYSAILLLSIDSQLNLIDRLEVSGGSCNGVYEDSKTDKVIWCPEKCLSNYTDSTLRIIQINKSSLDYSKNKLQIDSSITDYKINNKLKFIKI